MNAKYNFLLFILGVLLFSAVASAQVLVLEVADSHSAYDQLPGFIRSVDHLKHDFLKKYPMGRVVLIVAGDYGGRSQWTDDRGWMGIQALSRLAGEMDVVYVLGNHDAFDWGKTENGNRLVLRQLEFLHRAGVKIVGSNISFADDTKPLISPYFDLRSHAGRQVRFAGFGLEVFFQKSSYDESSKIRILDEISAPGAAMVATAEQAASDRVDDLIVFVHDNHERLNESLQVTRQELAKNSSQKPSLPVAFAAHDHVHHTEMVGSTLAIDSGSDFDFSAVELDANGTVAHHVLMSTELRSRENVKPATSKRLEKFAGAIERQVDLIRARTETVVGLSGGFHETKLDLKNGRATLGTALAETLHDWAAKQLKQSGTELQVIAFYNSSSYRRDSPIPAGPLSIGDLNGFYPFPGDAQLFTATGAEIQQLFSVLRAWRYAQDGNYTPQISDELSESAVNDLQIESRVLLHNGQPLEPNKTYALALDAWLAGNGYHLAEYEVFLNRHKPLARKNLTQVFQQFAPAAFARISPPQLSCSDIWK